MRFKIIDEKGRLFGWINIIDFFVIIFILSLIPMFWFGYKIFTSQPIQPIQPSQPSQIELLSQENARLKMQVDSFLKEHKHAKKYFPNEK